MITREQAVEILRRGIGRNDVDFRDGQWEAIDGILNHRRQLVVQRTGWGKSMIYFLAARFLRMEGRGMTLLISPLLALMRNQIAAAKRVGIVCDTINSTNRDQWPEIEERVISGRCDFLIVAPERFANEEFCANVLDRIKNNIGLLVVDEAHCVSDWGHDFRPDYKKISNLLKGLPPNMPVLATTATANMRVVRDIEAQLGGRVDVSRGSLVRKSLFLQNIRLRTQEERLAWLAETLRDRVAGSGVVYALTIRDAERIARWLRMNGLSAYAYSSGAMPPDDMEPALRKELEESETWKTIQHNCDCFKKQMERFIEFGEGKAQMVNNADWLLDLNYVDVLREVGACFSVNNMLRAECYKQRMEKGLSFLEFNYMIMQS